MNQKLMIALLRKRGFEVSLASNGVKAVAAAEATRFGDRDRCIAAGIDAYLAKPVRPAELYAAIDECLAAARAKS